MHVVSGDVDIRFCKAQWPRLLQYYTTVLGLESNILGL